MGSEQKQLSKDDQLPETEEKVKDCDRLNDKCDIIIRKIKAKKAQKMKKVGT
jgi:hypothetical protein